MGAPRSRRGRTRPRSRRSTIRLSVRSRSSPSSPRRTNPAGYADDKWQAVSLEPGQQAKKVPSKKYGSLYFRRVADEGEPAFEEKFFFQYQGDRVEKFAMRQPQG